jgi:preprotein translocase subunit SecY
MIIIWGSRICGDVDHVPQIGHVATRFFHLWYLPLIPMESFAIISQSGDQIHGARIPLSGKSIITAWLRTVLLLGGATCGIVAAVLFSERDFLGGAFLSGTALAALALYFLTRRAKFFHSASYERARQIGQHLGLNTEAMLLIDVAYGRMTAAEAEQALDQPAG